MAERVHHTTLAMMWAERRSWRPRERRPHDVLSSSSIPAFFLTRPRQPLANCEEQCIGIACCREGLHADEGISLYHFDLLDLVKRD